MRRRWREGRFLALLAASCLAIAGSVWSGVGVEPPAPPGGFRRVDPQLLKEKLQDGTLVRHPALYARPVGDATVPTGGR